MCECQRSHGINLNGIFFLGKTVRQTENLCLRANSCNLPLKFHCDVENHENVDGKTFRLRIFTRVRKFSLEEHFLRLFNSLLSAVCVNCVEQAENSNCDVLCESEREKFSQ